MNFDLLYFFCSDELEEGGEVEVNYLECEDASGYLTFNKEVQLIFLKL